LVGPPGLTGLHGLGQSFKVPAGAETPLTRTPKQHKVNPGFISGYFQGCLEQADHFQIQAVDDLGPIQGNGEEVADWFD
jgi:hypothetical protein